MISDLKPYSVMKDSGVVCLGKVPEHWDITTLRRSIRPFDGIKIGPFGSQLKLDQMSGSGYKVYGQANVIAHDFSRGTKFVSQEKFHELSACEVLPGDLLVTMMGTSGRCARVPNGAAMGIMDSHLLRLRTDKTISDSFAELLIDESSYMKEQITVAGKGSIMHGLNSGMIKALLVAVPPLAEQTSIVQFLDHADRRIRRYIRAKGKLIALLEEQKQATMHQAVTGRIDVRTGRAYPAYKDAGVEWLDEVPTHWEVCALRRKLRFLGGIKIGPFGSQLKLEHMSTSGYKVYGQSNVIAKDFTLGNKFVDQRKYDELSACKVLPGDLLVTMMGSSGRCAYVTKRASLGIMDSHLLRLRTKEDLTVRFASLLLDESPYMKQQITVAGKGSIMHGLNSEMVKALVVAVPPVSEQTAIVEFLDETAAIFAKGVANARREIELINQYRTRLIADVVTGKLDVREAAAHVPEEDVPGDAEESAEEYTVEEEVTV